MPVAPYVQPEMIFGFAEYAGVQVGPSNIECVKAPPGAWQPVPHFRYPLEASRVQRCLHTMEFHRLLRNIVAHDGRDRMAQAVKLLLPFGLPVQQQVRGAAQTRCPWMIVAAALAPVRPPGRNCSR